MDQGCAYWFLAATPTLSLPLHSGTLGLLKNLFANL